MVISAPRMPIIRETRPPANTRANRSRPSLSVPNQCFAEGPWFMSMLIFVWSYPQIWEPNRDSRMIRISRIMAKMATLFFRSRRQASFQ